jgi:creatinine amidohydrolase/Fe(II)-dependent formamide hydrolase-like protein
LLLIRGILAALRQKFHLPACPNFAGHLCRRGEPRNGERGCADPVALPDAIKHVALDPPRAPSGRFHGPADYRRRFPDGRIGSNPGLATPELGKRFYETAVSELVKTYQGFIGENK